MHVDALNRFQECPLHHLFSRFLIYLHRISLENKSFILMEVYMKDIAKRLIRSEQKGWGFRGIYTLLYTLHYQAEFEIYNHRHNFGRYWIANVTISWPYYCKVYRTSSFSDYTRRHPHAKSLFEIWRFSARTCNASCSSSAPPLVATHSAFVFFQSSFSASNSRIFATLVIVLAPLLLPSLWSGFTGRSRFTSQKRENALKFS